MKGRQCFNKTEQRGQHRIKEGNNKTEGGKENGGEDEGHLRQGERRAERSGLPESERRDGGSKERSK